MEQNVKKMHLSRLVMAALLVVAAAGDAKAADQQQEPEWVCDSSLRPGEVVDVATSVSSMVAPGRMSLSVAVDGSIERRQFVREVSSATRIDRRKVGFGFVLR